jgi:hypothetical protein
MLNVEMLKATISKADKGNSIVIISQEIYHKKGIDFINNNNSKNTNKDLITKFQRELRIPINECSHLIQKDEKCKYMNLNPSSLAIKSLIKIHETKAPIRPIINWKEAPAYKLAKKLAKDIEMFIPLPCQECSSLNK